MTSLIRFNDWTLDPGSGELERNGERRRLQEQPLQVLTALLDRPGQVVTREELVERLWPRGVVDFETGLNTAVRRLRAALDDDAETPRYIETLPRRGYRFIGAVSASAVEQPATAERTICVGATETLATRRDAVVVIHAPQHAEIGRRYPLQRDVVTIGRGAENTIVLASPSVSRRHARIERRDGAFYIVDEESTNGVLVNDGVRPASEASLRCGDELMLGDVILKFLSGPDVETQYRELLQHASRTDGLTGLCTRLHFDALLETELLRARRHARPLSLLTLEVDDLSGVSDRYGRLAGDAVLRGLASLLRKRLRPQDVLARCGAETLGVLLPETPLPGAVQIAEALRRLVATSVFAAGRRELRVTISTGAASLTDQTRPDELYAASAAALRTAATQASRAP
jgi:diguanylate cyclase (GGDEF)-like protein